MLISFDRKFIFPANTKAASTSVEHVLKKHCNVVITRQRFGKHFTYKTIVSMFEPVFASSGVPPEGYFRFGVIRDPVSWLVSWYNYRQRDALSPNSAKSTHGIGLVEFLEEAISPGKRRAFARLGQQANKFLDAEGKLGVDYLVPLPRLDKELLEIQAALELPGRGEVKKSKNVSPRHARVEDIDAGLRERIERCYAFDKELFDKAMQRGFGSVHDIVREKKAFRAAEAARKNSRNTHH